MLVEKTVGLEKASFLKQHAGAGAGHLVLDCEVAGDTKSLPLESPDVHACIMSARCHGTVTWKCHVHLQADVSQCVSAPSYHKPRREVWSL